MFENIAIAAGQVGAFAGFLMWMAKVNAKKLDVLVTDVSVIKDRMVTIRDDHDKIIEIRSLCDKCK
jgi:hypothetical protein